MPPEDRHSGVPGGNGSGADVKAGSLVLTEDGGNTVVTFGTPFAAVPIVVASFGDGGGQFSTVTVQGPSVDDFSIKVEKIGGGGSVQRTVVWIATDAGDP